MNKVIEALECMAKGSLNWNTTSNNGFWYFNTYGARSKSHIVYVGFNKDELREFLKHYEELSNKIGQLGEVTNEKRIGDTQAYRP